MKKNFQNIGKVVFVLFFTFHFQLSTFNSLAQSPQSFQYQAVVRDASGNALQSHSVNFQLSIILGPLPGTVQYVETHALTTNTLGIATLAVGSGTPVTNLFSNIDWSVSPHFLKVEADPGGGYVNMGTTQLLSVPYALYAQEAGNVQTYSAGTGITLSGTVINAQTTSALWNANQLQSTSVSSIAPTTNQILKYDGTSWSPTIDLNTGTPGGLNKTIQFNNSGSFGGDTAIIWDNTNKRLGVGTTSPNGRMIIRGSTTALATDPLFEVKNAAGQTIFVVYPDSVHVYVKDDGTKSNQGGFAVSGRNSSKAITNDYLNITPDQTRIYTTDPISGFGVGDVGTGTAVNYMHLTPQNYLIGHNAGENLNAGSFNLLLGYQAGKSIFNGSSNICIGYQAGFNGYNYINENILLGNYAGYKTNSSSNIFIGKEAGYNNIKGDDNIYIGNQAGYTSLGYDSVPSLSYHALNTIIGSNAGKSLATLQGNTIIGASACKNSLNSTGSTIIGCNACLDGNLLYSTVIGIYAGASATGTDNIYIGGNCGRSNIGNNNVFIGNSLYSYASDHLNNKFILYSSTNSHPLLFGDFFNNQLVVNGDSSQNTTSLKFFVNGSAGGLFAWSNVSDAKFKKNIVTIANPLDKVKGLRGVNFEWNDSKKFEEGIQMGFIAQEVEKIIPEVIRVKDGNYSMQYAPLTALLVEAIKDQQKQIEELKSKIEKMNNVYMDLDNLKVEIEKLKKYQSDK